MRRIEVERGKTSKPENTASELTALETFPSAPAGMIAQLGIPERTKLYPLKPATGLIEGLASSAELRQVVSVRGRTRPLQLEELKAVFVEGQASFAMRLASKHHVWVGDFVAHYLSGIPNPHGELCASSNRHSPKLHHWSSPNGTSERTLKLAYALEVATSIPSLQKSTLLPFSNGVDEIPTKTFREWCPICLEEWKSRKLPIIEPLLWTIEGSILCPLHRISLRSACPNSSCGKKQAAFGFHSLPGLCDHCRSWLGATAFRNTEEIPLARSERENAEWVTEQLMGLLAILPRVNAESVRATMRRNLATYSEKADSGKLFDFAAHIGVTRPVLWNWLRGSSLPYWRSVLRIAKRLQIPVASLFDENEIPIEHLESAQRTTLKMGARDVQKQRSRAELRNALIAALNDPVPRSVSETARLLGYASPTTLYVADRKLCFRIAKRYRRFGPRHGGKKPGGQRVCNDVEIKAALEKSLASPDPVSSTALAAQLGYADGGGTLRKKHPGLCQAIAKKTAAKRRARFDELRQTLKTALREVPPPTLFALTRRLGYSNPAVLRSHEPELCIQLRELYKSFQQEHWKALENKAMSLLSEDPLPSLIDALRRLGVPKAAAIHFPKFREQLAAKRQAKTKERSGHKPPEI